MSDQIEALVLRGTVEQSSGNLPSGILGRSFAGRQLFHVGQTLVLPTSEFEREKLGVVAARGPGAVKQIGQKLQLRFLGVPVVGPDDHD